MFRGPSFHFSRPSGEYVKRWGDSGWETVREHLGSTISDLPQRVESLERRVASRRAEAPKLPAELLKALSFSDLAAAALFPAAAREGWDAGRRERGRWRSVWHLLTAHGYAVLDVEFADIGRRTGIPGAKALLEDKTKTVWLPRGLEPHERELLAGHEACHLVLKHSGHAPAEVRRNGRHHPEEVAAQAFAVALCGGPTASIQPVKRASPARRS